MKPQKPSTFPPTFLSCILGGAVAGVVEFFLADRSTLPAQIGLSVLLFCAAQVALIGASTGLLIVLLRRLADTVTPLRTTLGALIVLATCVWFGLPQALPLGALLLAALYLSRKSGPGIAAATCAAVLLALIKPLFTGHSITLVFTPLQVLSCTALGALTVLALSWLIVPVFLAPATKTSIVRACAGAACGVLLGELASIFLIRLWGFNTMLNLQVAFVHLEALCFAMPFWILVARWSRRTINVLLAALVAALVISYATVFPAVFSTQAGNRFVWTRTPNASMLLGMIALTWDADRDFFSGLMGDCNDHDAAINPLAIDWPRNGIDENCFAGDLKSLAHSFFNIPVQVTLPPAAQEGARPRVVLYVTIDTLRADFVNYQPGNADTPNLAALAARSMSFERAYAQSNNTQESFPNLLQLGFRNLPWYNSDWTLAHYLKQASIASTALFQTSATHWWPGHQDAAFFGFDEIIRPGEETRGFRLPGLLQKADEAVARNKGKSFFLFTHIESLHDSSMQDLHGEDLIDKGLDLAELRQLWDIKATVASLRTRYAETLRGIDGYMGDIMRLVQKLEENSDVLLVFTSDHGEEFYEHGGLFHLGTLYEEAVRIPLIIYRSGAAPQRITTATAAYRIAPTILDFLGFEGRQVEELSLFRSPAAPHDIFAQFSLQLRDNKRSFMVLDDTMKLIYEPARARLELYDLSRDPREQHDLTDDPQYASRKDSLMRKMDTTLFFMTYGDIVASQARR